MSEESLMTTDDKKFIIVFNGEIYNFKKIKKELINDKVNFKTNSDTEVILALYKHRGEDGLRLLRECFPLQFATL